MCRSKRYYIREMMRWKKEGQKITNMSAVNICVVLEKGQFVFQKGRGGGGGEG